MEKQNNLKILERKDINDDKWNQCISNSINYRHQALTWHLDIVSPGWKGVIYGDYEAVMPYPLMHKYGIPVLLQPVFCQQLGIFSPGNLDKSVIVNFYRYLRRPFPVQYNINSSFPPLEYAEHRFQKLPNIELNLNLSYTELFNNYSKNTKRNIKKAQKASINIEEVTPYEDLFFVHYKNLRFKFNNRKKILFKKIIYEAFKREEGLIYIATNNNDKIIAIAFFIKFNNRLTFIVSSSSKQGYKTHAMYYIFDEIIKRFSNNDTILDFEGSATTGVAKFYKSFGGIDNPYLQISNISFELYKYIASFKNLFMVK